MPSGSDSPKVFNKLIYTLLKFGHLPRLSFGVSMSKHEVDVRCVDALQAMNAVGGCANVYPKLGNLRFKIVVKGLDKVCNLNDGLCLFIFVTQTVVPEDAYQSGRAFQVEGVQGLCCGFNMVPNSDPSFGARSIKHFHCLKCVSELLEVCASRYEGSVWARHLSAYANHVEQPFDVVRNDRDILRPKCICEHKFQTTGNHLTSHCNCRL